MNTSAKKIFPVIILIFIASFIISCGQQAQQNVQHEINVNAYDTAKGRSFTYTKYELPLSVDIYKFLKKAKVPYNQILMHKIKDQDKYFTEIKRAFVMGIYSSDLAYAAINEQSQQAVDYLATTIELANKLNIQDGYNTNSLDRAYKNLSSSDSLSYIVGESYWRTCTILEKTNRDYILPLIVAGSWIESMHILSRNCVGSPQGSPLFSELHQQLRQLDNMIKYLGDSSEDIKNTTARSEIISLTKRLELIKVKYSEIDLSDPSEFTLGQFKDVIFQVEDLRNTMLE